MKIVVIGGAGVVGASVVEILVGDTPSVADFYLVVMLHWAVRFDVPTPPVLAALRGRRRARPAVQRALCAEGLD